MMMLLLLLTAFVCGALAILAVEAVGVLILIRWLNRRIEREEEKAKATESSPSSPGDHYAPFHEKQGVVWVLESENVPKPRPADKLQKEQKRKKEIVEVLPVKRYAKIKNHSLVLTESDGSKTVVKLKGCRITAVSATSFSSRKWAKRYPIKVECKTSAIYKGSDTMYIYLDTSWEKESWCKALRIASLNNKEKHEWFSNLNLEFHNYLITLNTGHPSFIKPSSILNACANDKSIKIDGSSSKVRQFLKKLAKRASKSSLENKPSLTSLSLHGGRKMDEKSLSFQDSGMANGSVKMVPGKSSGGSNSLMPSSLSSSLETGSQSHLSVISDTDTDYRSDEGTLCWNLLIARLFFDAKANQEMITSLQTRIQRMLSNMRSPSYIGEVTCTGVDPGNLPPYIHAMRVLPSNMDEVWAFEVDIEYSGGMIMDIKTRFEVQELDAQDMDWTSLATSTAEEAESDLLEGFADIGKQLNLAEDVVDEAEQKDGGAPREDEIKSLRIIARASSSRWKTIINSIAKQVSQVPLSLGIRLAYIRGTMRLYIKPPPSDQIWFGFTSMPDVDFNLESFVGDHKITSGHLALFLVSRFKAAIRDALVLPNCESMCIPWMLAEKDDWVPQKVAPFIWINQEATGNCTSTTKPDVPSSSTIEASEPIKEAKLANRANESTNDGNITKKSNEPSDICPSVPGIAVEASLDDNPLQELRAPLLKNEEHDKGPRSGSMEDHRDCSPSSRSLTLSEDREWERERGQIEEDDTKPRRVGTRARMLVLGKKLGEKLEEKRRHIEEKGRFIVERVKGP